jgi:phenylacetate-CoA ligase
MSQVIFRKWLYFAILQVTGHPVGIYYKRYLKELQTGIPVNTTRNLLIRILSHCKQSVPYYAEIIRTMGDGFKDNPEEYLRHFPILTKEIIRSHFEELKSTDLPERSWFYNTSGGSTGEPVRLIQDMAYIGQSGAIKFLFSKLIGKEIGEREIYLWGSTNDIEGSESWRASLINSITRTSFLSAYNMTPERMCNYIDDLDKENPKCLVGYVEAIYELSKFAEMNDLKVNPQKMIIATAGTLFPDMRGKIEKVFQCRVWNRYGSREVGDIACERPGYDGLWVAPWGSFIEIVDEQGNRVPDGEEGEILVTSLINDAMPLIRYKIGDRGKLSPKGSRDHDSVGQVFATILGRSADTFTTKTGGLVYGGYFRQLLFFRDWIANYQIIQKSYTSIVFKIVKTDLEPEKKELDDIAAKVRKVMGDDCEATFEFVDEIPSMASGKFRYTISEIYH